MTFPVGIPPLAQNLTDAIGAEAASIEATRSIPAQTYTPTWTAVTTDPAIGNGELTGRHWRIGRLVFFMFDMTASTTTTFGSGRWSFGLPSPVDNGSYNPNATVFSLDSGGTVPYFGAGEIGTGTSENEVSFMSASGVAGWMDATTPFTWATGDRVRVSGAYLAAI